MDNLEIEIRGIRVLTIVLSIFLILSGLAWFIEHISRLTVFHILYSLFIILSGVLFLSGRIETDKLLIRSCDDFVYIK